MDFKTDIQNFSVDFSDSDLILAEKAYPKGTFAVNMLNRDKEKNTALLTEAVPLYMDKLKEALPELRNLSPIK